MAAEPNTRARMLSKTRCRMAAAAVTMALMYAFWRQLSCGEMVEHYMDMNLSHCFHFKADACRLWWHQFECRRSRLFCRELDCQC